MQIFLSLLPTAMKLFGWILDKSAADRRVKEQWLKTVDAVERHMHLSVKLNQSDREQMKNLRAQWEKQRR